MTTQLDYTAADWELLVGAPALAVLVITRAERCRPGVAERKLQTALTAMMEPVPPGPGSELITAVADAVRGGQSPRWPSAYPRELIHDVGGWALERCLQITALLAQQAPAAEAEAFSQWLYAIGQQVVLAPEEHPAAGQAPAPPTHQQLSALDQLAVALDLPLAADGQCALSVCWRPSRAQP